MEQKPLSRIENEVKVVGNVTNVETFSWEYAKGKGNGIDELKYGGKLTKVLDVLCDVITVLSEELPDIGKTACKLEWIKDDLIELKVSDVKDHTWTNIHSSKSQQPVRTFDMLL